jgi:2-polyprenyl-3-methyl-5-hydroxy-6-metoxy-1,4-benzoquinol methylase
MKEKPLSFYSDLNFDDFQKLARDHNLSRHQKVGFPDDYREGHEQNIFNDICDKVTNVFIENQNILDIGPGCSKLPEYLYRICLNKNSQLSFVDGKPMLDLLPEDKIITKYQGRFPSALEEDFNSLKGTFDVIISYSVIQYVFADDNLWKFLDNCLSLLSNGGQLLLGDIPNSSMRKRFFCSDIGIETHKKFSKSDEVPKVNFNCIEPNLIDDSAVFGLLNRARTQGFHAWVLPQQSKLPFANRREDILIVKP